MTVHLVSVVPRYVVGDADLTDFVQEWLSGIDACNNSLLLVASTPESSGLPGETREYGMAGLMSCIGPRVWGEGGTREELLLYAVLATYQDHLTTQPPGPWPGVREHLRRAFAYVAHVGVRESADALRRSVGRRARLIDPAVTVAAAYWQDRSPARRAAHEQQMADGDLRDLRAATALDGRAGDPWLSMPTPLDPAPFDPPP